MKKICKVLVCVILAIIIPVNIIGCSRHDIIKDNKNTDNPVTSNDAESTDNANNLEISGKTADQQFISSQLNFALELFKQNVNKCRTEGNNNVLVSPLSVMLALSMTANGADGETLKEMEKVLAATDLGGSLTIDDLNEYLYAHAKKLSSDYNAKLHIANSIWIKDQYAQNIKGDFTQKSIDYYGAEVTSSPFDASTINDINNWVRENTDGMINKIIENTDAAAVMILVNALCFDAEWDIPYEEKNISDGKFTNIDKSVTDVKMMHSSEHTYLEGENCIGFKKSYNGNQYSFAALLPDEKINVYDYVNSLDHVKLAEILNNSSYKRIIATMPKFEFDYSITLNDALISMGMEQAFSPNADFSRMSDTGLAISNILHKTYISVAEQGTRAGASTAVMMNGTGSAEDSVIIKLDRPFVFMIIDNDTNLPIFIGCVTKF